MSLRCNQITCPHLTKFPHSDLLARCLRHSRNLYSAGGGFFWKAGICVSEQGICPNCGSEAWGLDVVHPCSVNGHVKHICKDCGYNLCKEGVSQNGL